MTHSISNLVLESGGVRGIKQAYKQQQLYYDQPDAKMQDRIPVQALSETYCQRQRKQTGGVWDEAS